MILKNNPDQTFSSIFQTACIGLRSKGITRIFKDIPLITRMCFADLGLIQNIALHKY